MRTLMMTCALAALAANKDEGSKGAVNLDLETGEVLETTAMTTSEKAASGVMIAGQKYAVVNLVNVPTLKHNDNTTIGVKIDAPIFVTQSTKEVDGIDSETKAKVKVSVDVPINVVRVTQLDDGKPYEYVCNAMTADNLRNAYPGDTYVGRCFAITKHGLVDGKQYKRTSVVEIAPV